MSMNKAIIAGNLCRDPELRETGGGMAVLEICVAVNDRKKNAQGEYEDYPNYIDCTMFGSRAEKLAGILNKGMKVCVMGRLHQDRWKDKITGKNRSSMGIYVDDVELMTRAAKSEQAEVSAYQAPYDEDIPF